MGLADCHRDYRSFFSFIYTVINGSCPALVKQLCAVGGGKGVLSSPGKNCRVKNAVLDIIILINFSQEDRGHTKGEPVLGAPPYTHTHAYTYTITKTKYKNYKNKTIIHRKYKHTYT